MTSIVMLVSVSDRITPSTWRPELKITRSRFSSLDRSGLSVGSAGFVLLGEEPGWAQLDAAMPLRATPAAIASPHASLIFVLMDQSFPARRGVPRRLGCCTAVFNPGRGR